MKCNFYTSHCVFQKEQSDEIMGIGKLKGNMYLMDYVLEKYYCSFFNNKDMTAQEWHLFLVHPLITTMKHLNIKDERFQNEALQALENCEICYRARQTRDPFPTLNRRSSVLFDFIPW